MSDQHPDDPIILADYDPAWAAAFERERERIAAALGAEALAIEHIGSTAVPGLRAKPIIDILVAVERLEDGAHYAPRLAPLGYVYRPHDEDAVRLFFLKRSPARWHLHLVQQGSWEHRRHVLFRDVLRADPALARDYAALKERLADEFRHRREAYTEAKSDFINRAVAAALENERHD